MAGELYNKIIGRGMTFPMKLTTNSKGETGWYPENGDTSLISNNLNGILSYSIGQRFRQEDFGSRLWECIEEPNTQARAFIIRTFIKDAVKKYESRITIQSTKVEVEDYKVRIFLRYTINDTQEESQLSLLYDNQFNPIQTI